MRLGLLGLLLAVLIAAPAYGYEFPGQEPAPPIITDLVARASAFWQAHGITACPQGVDAWEARTLHLDDGDAWGRGDDATCEIWVETSLVKQALNPLWLGDGIEVCTAVTHEVGHAYGLDHTQRGVMAGSGAPSRMYGWSPPFCFRWARFLFAAELRGAGASERSVRRRIRYEEHLIRAARP